MGEGYEAQYPPVPVHMGSYEAIPGPHRDLYIYRQLMKGKIVRLRYKSERRKRSDVKTTVMYLSKKEATDYYLGRIRAAEEYEEDGFSVHTIVK